MVRRLKDDLRQVAGNFQRLQEYSIELRTLELEKPNLLLFICAGSDCARDSIAQAIRSTDAALADNVVSNSHSFGAVQRDSRFGRQRLLSKPGLVDREILCFAHDDRSLDHVLQFADVPWPGVGAK